MTAPDVRTTVRSKYAQVASAGTSCGCGPAARAAEIATEIGYSAEELRSVPEGSNLGLGCGAPLRHAALAPGEVVLDLGSGAGMDAFLAVREVGPEGRVIGVDMTPDMIEKARANAVQAGAPNVEFRLGEIEHLPVADSSVDVVISNCVVNLSPDKPQVFREAYRALRSGGRLVISDIVVTGELPDESRASVEAYVGCVAGALKKEEYLDAIRLAGFEAVEVVEERSYGTSEVFGGEEWLRQAAGAIASIKVRAVKPRG
ncbi:MAG TPA: arsenite methyltransferase [Gemmatimonadales bacterium]|nr:arsenite methyltransferase [Gemmatimonadales bacterium]